MLILLSSRKNLLNFNRRNRKVAVRQGPLLAPSESDPVKRNRELIENALRHFFQSVMNRLLDHDADLRYFHASPRRGFVVLRSRARSAILRGHCFDGTRFDHDACRLIEVLHLGQFAIFAHPGLQTDTDAPADILRSAEADALKE